MVNGQRPDIFIIKIHGSSYTDYHQMYQKAESQKKTDFRKKEKERMNYEKKD